MKEYKSEATERKQELVECLFNSYIQYIREINPDYFHYLDLNAGSNQHGKCSSLSFLKNLINNCVLKNFTMSIVDKDKDRLYRTARKMNKYLTDYFYSSAKVEYFHDKIHIINENNIEFLKSVLDSPEIRLDKNHGLIFSDPTGGVPTKELIEISKINKNLDILMNFNTRMYKWHRNSRKGFESTDIRSQIEKFDRSHIAYAPHLKAKRWDWQMILLTNKDNLKLEDEWKFSELNDNLWTGPLKDSNYTELEVKNQTKDGTIYAGSCATFQNCEITSKPKEREENKIMEKAQKISKVDFCRLILTKLEKNEEFTINWLWDKHKNEAIERYGDGIDNFSFKSAMMYVIKQAEEIDTVRFIADRAGDPPRYMYLYKKTEDFYFNEDKKIIIQCKENKLRGSHNNISVVKYSLNFIQSEININDKFTIKDIRKGYQKYLEEHCEKGYTNIKEITGYIIYAIGRSKHVNVVKKLANGNPCVYIKTDNYTVNEYGNIILKEKPSKVKTEQINIIENLQTQKEQNLLQFGDSIIKIIEKMKLEIVKLIEESNKKDEQIKELSTENNTLKEELKEVKQQQKDFETKLLSTIQSIPTNETFVLDDSFIKNSRQGDLFKGNTEETKW